MIPIFCAGHGQGLRTLLGCKCVQGTVPECRGLEGPHDAGCYNSRADETGFFCDNGSWNSEYGRFFLKWYSDGLLRHCDRIMGAASSVLARRWPPQQARLRLLYLFVGFRVSSAHSDMRWDSCWDSEMLGCPEVVQRTPHTVQSSMCHCPTSQD